MDFDRLQFALLHSESLQDAAKSLGCSLSDLLAAINEPDTRRRLDQEARASYDESMRRLQRSIGKAIDTLRLAIDPSIEAEKRPTPDQCESAKTLLNQGLKAGKEYNDQTRLAEIERQLAADAQHS